MALVCATISGRAAQHRVVAAVEGQRRRRRATSRAGPGRSGRRRRRACSRTSPRGPARRAARRRTGSTGSARRARGAPGGAGRPLPPPLGCRRAGRGRARRPVLPATSRRSASSSGSSSRAVPTGAPIRMTSPGRDLADERSAHRCPPASTATCRSMVSSSRRGVGRRVEPPDRSTCGMLIAIDWPESVVHAARAGAPVNVPISRLTRVRADDVGVPPGRLLVLDRSAAPDHRRRDDAVGGCPVAGDLGVHRSPRKCDSVHSSEAPTAS